MCPVIEISLSGKGNLMSDDNINKPDGESCDSTEPCSCSQSDGKRSSGFGRGLKMLLCVLILIVAGVVAANAVINGKPKECDPASGCCPPKNTAVVEQDNTPETATEPCGTEPCGTEPCGTKP